jgi:OHCU decarboxylase
VIDNSPWVLEEARRLDAPLGEALEAVIRGASRERQLSLVRGHPELSSGGPLSEESAREQAGAGLDRGGTEQRALNAAYRERFGFPFVVCVREHTPESILAWGRERLDRTFDEELATAIDEIVKIGRLRIDDLDARA